MYFHGDKFNLQDYDAFNTEAMAAQFVELNEGPKSAQNLLSCPFCPRMLVKKSHLTEHIKTHTGEKPFQCSACPQSFTRRYHLKRHLKMVHKVEINIDGLQQ